MKTRAAILTLLVFGALGSTGGLAGEGRLSGALFGEEGISFHSHEAETHRAAAHWAAVLPGSFTGTVAGMSAATVRHGERYWYVGPSPGRSSGYSYRDRTIRDRTYHRHYRHYRHFGPQFRHYGSRDCKIVTYHTTRHGQRYLIQKRICRADHEFDRGRFYHGGKGWHRGHGYGGRHR